MWKGDLVHRASLRDNKTVYQLTVMQRTRDLDHLFIWSNDGADRLRFAMIWCMLAFGHVKHSVGFVIPFELMLSDVRYHV